MTVTKAEISAMFDALLTELAREEIARWAQERRRADDLLRMLVYEPAASGVADLGRNLSYRRRYRGRPGSYLFSSEAFREFREQHAL